MAERKVCRDCGQVFTAMDRDEVMCLPCLWALMREDGEGEEFAREYAEHIAALPPSERLRLYTSQTECGRPAP